MKKILTVSIILVLVIVTGCGTLKNSLSDNETNNVNSMTCQQDLAFAQDYFLKNDAGAKYHLEVKGQAYFDSAYEKATQAAKSSTSIEECNKAINVYFKQWRKGHIGTSKPHGFFVNAFIKPILPYLLSSLFEPSIEMLSDNTVLIRLPSFKLSVKDDISELIADNYALLSQSPNWIIDVRNNGGGADSSFAPLLPWIMDTKAELKGLEILVTEDNFNNLKILCEKYNVGKACESRLAFMQQSPKGGLVKYDPKANSKKAFKPEQHQPSKIAILVNKKCASSCEQFLLNARQSDRVTLMGRNSAGVIDISNMLHKTLPSGDIYLKYAMSRSSRLPDSPIDGIGIAPDIYLEKINTKNSKRKEVMKAKRWLETGAI